MIKHGKTSKSVFSILLTTCSLLAGAVPIMRMVSQLSMPAVLYTSPDSCPDDVIEIFVPDGAEFPEEYDCLNLPEESVFFDKGNDYFIADDGEIYYFSSDPEAYATCDIRIKQDIPTNIFFTRIRAAITRKSKQSAVQNAAI